MRLTDHIFDANNGAEKYYQDRLLNIPPAARIIAKWMLGFFILFIAALFLPWQQFIKSQGEITIFDPQSRPQQVNSQIAGRIVQWYVNEGDYVEEGSPIIRLTEVKDNYLDPELLVRQQEQIDAKLGAIEATKEKITAQDSLIAALTDNRAFSLAKAENKILQLGMKIQADSAAYEAAKIDRALAENKLSRIRTLFEENGLKTQTEFQIEQSKFQSTYAKEIESMNKLDVSKNELLNARIEIPAIKAEYAEKIAKAMSDKATAISTLNSYESELAKEKNTLANYKLRSDNYEITAPRSGYIVEAIRSGVGEIIKEGEAVVSIVPANSEKAVALYIRPADLPLMNVGTKVRLQFDGWPAIQFAGWPDLSVGTFGGVVAVIDARDTQNLFRILVIPDYTDDAWPDKLFIGSGVIGWAMLEEVPVWLEIWRQLNAFPPNFPQQYLDSYATDSKSGAKADKKSSSDEKKK